MKPIIQWFDTAATISAQNPADAPLRNEVDWLRVIPFILMHFACLAVFWVGFSWVAIAVSMLLYALRMFAITAFYHRYFSHLAFRTSRSVQFIFALLGASATQRGMILPRFHGHFVKPHFAAQTPLG